MKYCPICERNYADDIDVCELDGATLRQSQAAADIWVGKTIKGRYRVIQKLGEGGMATVYLVEQINIERKAALKLLHGQYASDQEFVRRFRQEAKLAASLNHSNVIKVYDFDQAEDGSLFISMEYLEGKNLKEVMQTGSIDIARAVRLAIQIAEGLLTAHRAGVIHRDIKPENIMVVGDGNEIKLMDFGIARLRESGAATRLTRAGMIMGTPLYMAPEQIEGGEVTEKTDIYAFGIVLYEMLSGTAPFRAPTPAAILMKHLKEIPLPLRKVRGEVPAAIEKVVSRALEKKPDRRPANMAEIVESLKDIEARLPRDRVAKTLLMTQPLEVIHQGSDEPSSRLGALAAKIKLGALFTRGKTSTAQGDDRANEASGVGANDDPPPTSGTMAETLALTQPFELPARTKKLPWAWIGTGVAIILIGASAFFIGRDFRDTSGDHASQSGQIAAKTEGAATAAKIRVISAAIRGERAEVAVGERMRLALSARYEDGKQQELSDGVEWHSSDPAVLAVGSNGEIEARNPGKVEVSARYGDVEALPMFLTVRRPAPLPARLVSVEIRGGKAEINVGARMSLRARAKHSDGRESEIKQDVRWESSDGGIATVSATGQLEGRNEGKTTITAYYENMRSAPLSVVVRAAAKRQEPYAAKTQQGAAGKSEIQQQLSLARSYRDRGAYTEALAALEKARHMDPSNQDIQEEIAATRRACNAERKLGQTQLNC
jgi:serine/threonine protein kinase